MHDILGSYIPWHVRDEYGKRGLNVSAALKTSTFSEQSFIRELWYCKDDQIWPHYWALNSPLKWFFPLKRACTGIIISRIIKSKSKTLVVVGREADGWSGLSTRRSKVTKRWKENWSHVCSIIFIGWLCSNTNNDQFCQRPLSKSSSESDPTGLISFIPHSWSSISINSI